MKKNVIIIMTDEQRFDSLGIYGNNTVKTPAIDRMANSGTVFENTYCTSPLCVPSRVSFFTGNYVKKTRCTSNALEKHINLKQGSLVEVFKQNGYHIGLAGKNHTFDCDYAKKWFDFWEEYTHHGKVKGEITRKDQEVKNWRHNEKRFEAYKKSEILLEGLIPEPEPFPETQCQPYRITRDAINFIEKNRNNPFLLYYSFPDPHWPNAVCEPYYSMYDPNNIAVPDGLEMEWRSHPFAHYVQSRAYGFDNYTEKELKKLIAIYYGQITFIDKCVGTLMERVKELGLEEDTIVVFTADHGNFAGRYKLVGKTKAFYDALIRIPLIMKIPGIKKKRVKFNISNLDVMPTLIKATGIKTEINVQGKSFLKGIDVGHWDERDTVYAEIGDTEKPPPAMPPEEFKSYEKDRLKKDGLFWFIDYTVKGRGAMIREKDWKYCFYTDDREELYHLREDPLELYNLAKDKNHASRKDSLKSKLIEWLLV